MSDTPKVYVICDANCKFEGMTKEQIFAAITQAVKTGDIGDIDTGFVQTIKTINGKRLKFFVGEQSEYEALSEESKIDLFALITNDTAKDAILSELERLQTAVDENTETFLKLSDGDFAVGKAKAVEAIEETASSGTQYVWFSQSGDSDKRAYSADFQYNPVLNVLKVGLVEGKADRATEADYATEAKTANKLKNGDVIYGGRALIWKPIIDGEQYDITGTERSITTTSDLTDKFIIVEIEERAAEIYGSAIIARYRTIPFNSVKYTYNGVNIIPYYTLNTHGHALSFYVSGKTLYYKTTGDGGETAEKYRIKAIYEEEMFVDEI